MTKPALIITLLSLLIARLGLATPNIVVILADDLGYSDPACFGGEIPTPSLDRLARGGIRLSHFTNGGMCVVSRASLLTGQWWPTALRDFQKTETLPELLSKRGYRNALVGKWHLDGSPLDHGFHHFFGFLNGFTDHFAGSASYRLNRQPFTAFPPGYYSSDAFTDRAIDFVRSDPKKPFFLLLSYQAPHNPLQAPAEDIRRHRGNYLKGWQATREARFQRQKQLGLVPAGPTLPPYPENLPDWSTLTDAQRDLEDLRMATYAAMVERMDTGIGRLLDALDLDNTYVLFLSDNGTDPFAVADPAMLKKHLLPGDPGSNYQPGTGWAYASVTPWRLYKISQHAGGTTTGAILHGPAGTTDPGTIATARLHMVDILPTLTALTGDPQPAAGESFLPLLRGDWQRQKPLFYQYMDNRAIRTNGWTLAEVDGAGWELFDDHFESNNLASTHPQVVAQLNTQWLTWWKQQNRSKNYRPTPTGGGRHYHPQGDRGTGTPYIPTPMPKNLADRYPLP